MYTNSVNLITENSMNNYANTHIGMSIVIATCAVLLLIILMHVWRRASEFCGILYDNGWDSFKRRWHSWHLLKQLLFIIMYLCVIVGWLLMS